MKLSNHRPFCALSLFFAAVLAASGAADYATPYLFSTLAGTSSIGSQDGAGTAARFYSPRAVATDAAGNDFIVDNGNHTIRKITPAGVVTTFAGAAGIAGSADGTGAAARFDAPNDIVADSADNLYLTDTGNHTIRKITPAGVVTTLAGLAGVPGNVDGTGSAARFHDPQGIAADPSGNLYVTESGNGTIRKITPVGLVSTYAGDLLFSNPYYQAIAVDPTGNVYVSLYSFRDHRSTWIDQRPEVLVTDIGYIAKIAPDGTRTGLKQTSVVLAPQEVATSPGGVTDILIEPSGQFLLAGFNQIVRMAQDGATIPFSGSGLAGSADGPAESARFSGMLGLSLGRNGSVHVADTGNNFIRRVSVNRAVTTVAGVALEVAGGSVDGTGPAARFVRPAGPALDAAGNLYLADPSAHCIRKITPAGLVTTFAGSPGVSGSADGTGTAARFRLPENVAVDPAGNVFVADSDNHIIRRITPTGETSTFAGRAGERGSDDGVGDAARFVSPQGIAADAAGSLYVTSGATVRKISPTGNVTTLAGSGEDHGYADGPGSTARLTVPRGIAVDAAGNVYVTEPPNGPAIARIRKITPGGEVSTLAGGDQGYADGQGTAARFDHPNAVAVDAGGSLFVADGFNLVIRKITAQGTVTTLAGLVDALGSSDGTGQEARFDHPRGIAVDAAGALYVTSGTTVRKGVLATLPVISTQPANASAQAGGSASFSVTAGGTPAPAYQWQRNGSNLTGATGTTLSLANVQTVDVGDYTVVVTNAVGSVTSNKAVLTVTAPPAPPPPAPTGGGGGGAPSLWFLAGLGGLGMLRRATGLHRR